MEIQEAFDTVVNHLRTQGTRAVAKDEAGEEQCLYRCVAEDGSVTKCAAGCLIPDEDYKPSFENQTVVRSTEVGQYFLNKFNNDIRPIMLLRELQCIHDDADRFDHKEREFKRLAEDFGLTYTLAAV